MTAICHHRAAGPFARGCPEGVHPRDLHLVVPGGGAPAPQIQFPSLLVTQKLETRLWGLLDLPSVLPRLLAQPGSPLGSTGVCGTRGRILPLRRRCCCPAFWAGTVLGFSPWECTLGASPLPVPCANFHPSPYPTAPPANHLRLSSFLNLWYS